MRMRHALLALPLLAGTVLALAPQDTGAPKQDRRPPFTRFQEEERKKIEEKLPGVWTLVFAQFPGRTTTQQAVQGFAMFQDGFFAVILQAQAEERGILGPELALYFQAGMHRYRVSETLSLQTASILGFDNMNEDGEVEFVGSRSVREHPISLSGDELTIRSREGGRLVLRKLNETGFPRTALEFLQKNPGGVRYDDEDF